MKKIKIKRKVPIAFCGSLIQQDFGENVSKHGFLFWDIEKRTFEEFDIETDFGYYKFNVKSINDLDNNGETFMNP